MSRSILTEREISVYLSYLLRHHPEEAALDMDRHGWVAVDQLLANIQATCSLTREHLERIVAEDEKGRYRISGDGQYIKACQGHSISWVEPELAWGYISKMARHAVHMQPDAEKAWQSARRWKKRRMTPVVLVIDAAGMAEDGIAFGVSDNGVWCTERVDVRYVTEVLRT